MVRIDGINPRPPTASTARANGTACVVHGAGAWRPHRVIFQPRNWAVCRATTFEPDALQPLAVADVATLLRGIHQLPARHHRLDLAERLLGYEKRAAQHKPVPAARLSALRPAVG